MVVNNEELGDKIHFIQNSTGGILNPFDSWLLILIFFSKHRNYPIPTCNGFYNIMI